MFLANISKIASRLNRIRPGIKSHSEERRDEESRRGAGASRIFPTAPRPFAEFTLSGANVLRVT